MATQHTSASSMYPLVERDWKAVVNGSNSHNGAMHSVTVCGDIAAVDEGKDVYDVVAVIAATLKTLNAEMIHVHSLQITLGGPATPQNPD